MLRSPGSPVRVPSRRRWAAVAATAAAWAGLVAPAVADDRGVPDPTAQGPDAVRQVDYDAGKLLLPAAGGNAAISVPMKGSVTYPVRDDGGPAKVVVFVHGRHQVCIGDPGTSPGPAPGQCTDGSDPDGTPTTTDIRSYGGYAYLARNLASHGYAVMSIEANVSGFDGDYADAGADARSQIINASLKLLDRWNNGRGPVTADPDTTIGTKLVGRLELSSGIGLMGHSRGGDAVTDFVTFNRDNDRWPLSAVVALAPTSYANRRTPEGTNYATLLPACDGDVSNLQGARFFENAKYAAGNDGVAKVQWYVQGTNHNFFNTVWTGDDFGDGDDPACSSGAASTARLTPGDQRRVGLALMNGFLRRYVGRERAFDPLVTGEVTLPSTACPQESGKGCAEEVKTSYVPPKAQRLDVLRPAPIADPAPADAAVDPQSTTVAATGGAITTSGLDAFRVCVPEGLRTPYPACPKVSADFSGNPFVPGVDNESLGTQYEVAWNGPATIAAGLTPDGGSRDVAGFGALSLRVAVNRGDARNPAGNGIDPASATQDFDVVLTDADGKQAAASVARYTTSLEPSIGTSYRHVVLSGARVPLTAFDGVDLRHVVSVQLRFGGSRPTGSVQLSDLMFVGTSAPDAPPTVPPAVGPPAAPPTLLPTPSTPTTPCTDVARPEARLRVLRLSRTGLRVVGRATDRGCGSATGAAAGGVRATLVSVAKRSGEGCRFLTARGTWSRSGYCDTPVLLKARGTTPFSLRQRAALTPGRYRVAVLSYDRAGNQSRTLRRTVRVR